MHVQLTQPVDYTLELDQNRIYLNPCLNQSLCFRFTGNIFCIQCGRKTKTSFQQGYCYPCMQRLAECHFCIIHPEKCLVEQQKCAPDDWAHAQCAQPHIVYLANSTGLKVGITRLSQTTTRWIDQGACQALPMMQVANRRQSGMIEKWLKQFVNDKTDWRKLVKEPAALLDLTIYRQELLSKIEPVLSSFSAEIQVLDASVTQINYPITRYPENKTNLSFDKTPQVSGNLLGIKGQYLFLDTGVINIRKFSGYEVEVTC
jgi:hypothetical protein